MKSTVLALVCTALGLAATAHAGSAADFAALLDEHWEWRLAEYPTFASRLGDRRYNDR